MSECQVDARSRLDRTRKEEREYSRILCSFMRSLDARQRREAASERRERTLCASEAVRKQIETELMAGADSLGVAHESADSVQEMESSANDSNLARKRESESKARERYRLAISKLNKQKIEQHSAKKRAQLEAPKFSQESTFNAIAKAIETKRTQRREVESCPKLKPTTDAAVKKYTLSYVNVYSAVNKYKVEKSSGNKEVKAVDAAVEKNAETERKQAESAMRREEQLERARLRGKHADHVNKLEKDRQEILKELSFYQKKELQQKRTHLEANIPLEPPFAEKKAVERRKQRELESQFEKLFIPAKDPAGQSEPTQERALVGETKLRDLISQQRELCTELNGTDESIMTSLPDYSSQSLSVFALSATDTTHSA